MSIEERLERLERQNRWMKRGVGVAAALVAAVVLVAQAKPKELPDLEVRSLTVKDKDGNSRIRLSAGIVDGEQRTALTLADQTGTRRIHLCAGDLGTAMRIMTPGGKLLHSVEAAHSSRQFSEWTLNGPQGRMKSRLSLGADSAAFELLDVKGKVIWQAPKE